MHDGAMSMSANETKGDDEKQELLNSALLFLRSYRSVLYESRSGAASDKEQHALALTKLIGRIEHALRSRRE